MPIDSKKVEEAILHLKSIKPYDGWSADTYVNEKDEELITLRRRNVPLSSTGFTSIVHDENESNCVVGITSMIGETASTWFCRGVVLVEKDGTVARDPRDVRVTVPKKSRSTMGLDREQVKEQCHKNIEMARRAWKKREGEDKSSSSGNSSAVEDPLVGFSFLENLFGNLLLDMNNPSDVGKLILLLICAMTVLRILVTFRILVNIIVLPLLILYGIQTCPTHESFDAKKEFKRVLRGHHLPEGHEDKPANDWLSRTVARVTASVTAEAATAIGYEVSFYSMGGICTVASVQLPAMNKELYWLGIFGSWRYILQRNTNVSSTAS